MSLPCNSQQRDGETALTSQHCGDRMWCYVSVIELEIIGILIGVAWRMYRNWLRVVRVPLIMWFQAMVAVRVGSALKLRFENFHNHLGYSPFLVPVLWVEKYSLTSLLHRDQPFVWTELCRRAFAALKALLCHAPVLAAPDLSKPFKLAVDASAFGSGAVLFQTGEDGLDHPVSFFSKKFNRYELNYSTIEKEALGLMQALQHYEVYLKGHPEPISVLTDNNPLTFIHHMKSANQRILRWSLTLQEFNLSISHIPGTDNVIADALSRIFEWYIHDVCDLHVKIYPNFW